MSGAAGEVSRRITTGGGGSPAQSGNRLFFVRMNTPPFKVILRGI